MTGIELDRAVRTILSGVTPTLSLSATKALVALGFDAPTAFTLVCAVLRKDKYDD